MRCTKTMISAAKHFKNFTNSNLSQKKARLPLDFFNALNVKSATIGLYAPM